ncbi:hypothetical protein NIES2100_10170 [Calothrix sp. NIES-2100]|uniref:DUF2281 domain-containing protein n=1 Tax=Calothrix sp. NIES-2100 TaxID=1954172 RepID=UPI000B60AA90|nr:hypothetical protein NIES2100_10170 [Calothrix sp. NIES-2100]
MNSLKEKIIKKLERLPENAQQQVLDFVEFLESRKVTNQELRELQQEEIEEGCPVEYVGGVLVVQASGLNNWETFVHNLREERINKFTSW